MVTVAVAGDCLRVRFSGWSRVWTLSGGFDAPLSSVRGARADPGLLLAPDGIRVGGAYVPGRIVAGRYWRPGFSSFWCVRDPKRTVIIDLSGWRYDRLVLQVNDPNAVAAEIRRAAGSDPAPAPEG